MRLLSLSVRHYRVHQDVRIEFDAARTLVGGPNESGKSTLAEAAHRALFLRAALTGEAPRTMESRGASAGERPTVELEFEARGERWHLKKIFRPTGGSIALTDARGQTLSGDEAEEKLATLLGTVVAERGPGALKRLAAQWAHLWVWQGESGDDPSAHATRERDALLARLHDFGGAAPVQSDRDARLAAAFSAQRSALLTERGLPRAGTELALLAERAAADAAAVEAARQRLTALEQAMDAYGAAEDVLTGTRVALAQLTAEQRTLEAREERVRELQRVEAAQAASAQGARQQVELLASAQQELARREQAVQRTALALAPAQSGAERGEGQLAELQRAAQALEQRLLAAEQTAAARRARHEWARAADEHRSAVAARDEWKGRAAQAQELEQRLAETEREIARLPEIDRALLKKLRDLEDVYIEARAALEATAATLTVEASPLPVLAGLETLAPGATCRMEDETPIVIGADIRLRLHPGGGRRLAELRREALKAQRARDHELARLGVPNVSSATELNIRRETRLAEAAVLRSQLSRDPFTTRLAEASAKVVTLEAAMARALRLVPEASAPESAEALRQLRDRAADEASEAEEETRRARLAAEAARKQAARAEEELSTQRRELEKLRREHEEALAVLQALRGQAGASTERAAAVAVASGAQAAAEAALATTLAALAELRPEEIAPARARLERASQQQNAAREQASLQRAMAEATLRRDGSVDPHEDLAEASTRAEASAAELARARRHADALTLLDRLYREEQAALAAEFTGPLVERVNGYLRQIFGPGAQAVVEYRDGEFGGLRLRRGDGPGEAAIDFDALSGGTREQVAAAVRLAMAEVLAPQHDGCLPVVFDDAFAFADPQRVRGVIEMLDLAARRGLQVVVLTCTPAEYASWGARVETLRGR